jgi:MFS family permease
VDAHDVHRNALLGSGHLPGLSRRGHHPPPVPPVASRSAAGETDRPADAIALVTSIGYGSILVGPPLIGALADGIGLGRALLGLSALTAAVAALAPVLSVRDQPASASMAR